MGVRIGEHEIPVCPPVVGRHCQATHLRAIYTDLFQGEEYFRLLNNAVKTAQPVCVSLCV